MPSFAQPFLLISLLPVVALAQSYQYVTDTNYPADNLQDACKAALTKTISCNRATSRFNGEEYFYDPSELAQVCTTSCRSSLGDYHAGVAQACADATFVYDEANIRPIPAISYLLVHNYDLTCLQSDGRWCNSVIYNKGLQADPTLQPEPGLVPNNVTVGDCDLCLIKNIKLRAEAAIGAGSDVASHYTSVTSSCSVSTLPLSSTTLPGVRTTSTSTSASPSPTCAGTIYQVKSGDSCRSIALSQKISVGWLVNDNPGKLNAYCSGFDTTSAGSLCISNTCQTYSVKASDTCKSIAKANNITAVQLISWNPILNSACTNLRTSLDDPICISKPGTPYNPSVVPPPVATSFTTAAPVPTNVASNTTTKCGRYYTVEPNDYCNLLCVRFGLSLDDFLFLNPAVNKNCTNLFAQESYCVAPVGSITDYPGHPGYVAPITSEPSSAYTAFPTATFTFPALNLTKPLPIANQTRSDCYLFVAGTDLQADYAAAFYRSACAMYIAAYHITAEALQNWNPSLDPSSASCSFDKNFRYCLSAYDPNLVPAPVLSPPPTDPPSSPSTTTTSSQPAGPTAPGPTQSGQPSNCNKWYVAKSGDNCDGVERSQGITDAQFHAWNPAVSSDCSQGFWGGYAYCVGVSGGTTTQTTSSSTTSAIAVPTPTQANSIASNCNKFAKADSGTSCSIMAQANAISVADLARWNTVLGADGKDCSSQYWLGYYYCVGVRA